MTTPTIEQIKQEGQRLAQLLGGGVHLRPGDLALAVDAKYPGMSDAEMADVRGLCAEVADALRTAALSEMWGDR